MPKGSSNAGKLNLDSKRDPLLRTSKARSFSVSNASARPVAEPLIADRQTSRSHSEDLLSTKHHRKEIVDATPGTGKLMPDKESLLCSTRVLPKAKPSGTKATGNESSLPSGKKSSISGRASILQATAALVLVANTLENLQSKFKDTPPRAPTLRTLQVEIDSALQVLSRAETVETSNDLADALLNDFDKSLVRCMKIARSIGHELRKVDERHSGFDGSLAVIKWTGGLPYFQAEPVLPNLTQQLVRQRDTIIHVLAQTTSRY